MQEDRVELAFPFGGLSDSESETDAPTGSTGEAINVRPFDPVTGRRRGSQRSGLAKFSQTKIGTGRIQALGAVSFDNSRVTYELANPPTADTTVITPAKGTAYAVIADRWNNIWAYDGLKTLVKYSPEGVVLEQIALTTFSATAVVTRLRLDEFGALYVGLRASGTSSVQKYEEDEDRGWTHRWGCFVQGTLRDFDLQNDMLYALIETGQYLSSGCRSYIRTYAGLQATIPPTRVWEKEIPAPAHAIETISDGSVYFTAPQNPARVFQDPDTGTFDLPVVDWTPGHLTNANQRIHYWVDASNIAENHDGIIDDVEVPTLNSILARNAVYNSFEAKDTTPRVASHAEPTLVTGTFPEGISGEGTWGMNMFRSSPRYAASHWGVMPALRSKFGTGWFINDDLGDTLTYVFPEIPGDCLVSGHNTKGLAQGDQKADVNGTLEHNRAPIPGNLATNSHPCDNQKFIFALVGRIDPATRPRGVVFSIYDQPLSNAGPEAGSCCIAMIAEGDTGLDTEADGSGEANQGKVSIVFKGATFTDAGDSADTNTAWVPFDLKAIDAEQRFILTIVADGSGARKGAIRINGRNVDSITLPADYRLEGSEFASGYSRGCHGRMFMGSPVEGTSSITGDAYTSSTGFLGMYVTADCWHKGTPAWVGNWNHSTFGGPAAGYTAEKWANVDEGEGAGITNCTGFNGDFCEILTVLPNHTGTSWPQINDDSSSLVPLYTGGGDIGQTAKRGDANCNTQNGTTDVEKIEGYLAWKWGIASLLPSGAGTDSNGLYADHKYNATESPPATGGSVTYGYDNVGYNLGVATTRPLTGKLDPTGQGKWATQAGGMGYGLAVKEDTGEIYTVGPCIEGGFGGGGTLDAYNYLGGTAIPQAWKISDRGTYASGAEAFDCWWYDRQHANDELSSGVNQRYPRLALDKAGNLYWPLANQIKANHVRRLAAGGQFLTTGEHVGERRGYAEWQYSLNSECQAFGVAVTDDDLDFRSSPGMSGPEFIWIASDNGQQDGSESALLPQLHKINQFSSTLNFAEGVSSRETRLVAVGSGTVYSVDSSTQIASIADGGLSVLDPHGAFVSSVPAFQHLYFADGLNYVKFDPVVNRATPWVAEKGAIPRKCKLVSFWRGRMIVARDPEDPHNWHMSAVGEPDDWDFDPRVYVASMAINGNNSRAGRSPDIVNSIIPYNDDLILFGCDSNIYRLTGDPMAGGQLDMVSNATGTGFGNCWCRDPEGALYFFGSRGGVYRLTPPEGITSFTADSIERRLQNIDLTRYKIRLIWNTEEQGLHVVQAPHIDDYFADNKLTSWFWDRRNNAWFEDECSDPSKQASCLVTFDGDDPGDRTLILGCEDGFLRKYSRRARSDDGATIDSRVLFGPLVEESSMQALRFGQLGVELASEQQGAEYDWHVSRAADVLGDPARSGKLRAGPNPIIGGKHRGASSWVRIRNASRDERWSLEALSMSVRPAGRKRI